MATEPHNIIPDDILEGLSSKQAKFVCSHAAGKTGKDAAIEAGYAATNAKFCASRLLKNPRVARAVEAIRRQGVADARYDLNRLIHKFEDVAAFAIKTGNAMAYNKSMENIGRLSGFLDHRIEVNVVQVDIVAALEEAHARVARRPPNIVETIPYTDIKSGS
jgi:phage terminase small subunit